MSMTPAVLVFAQVLLVHGLGQDASDPQAEFLESYEQVNGELTDRSITAATRKLLNWARSLAAKKKRMVATEHKDLLDKFAEGIASKSTGKQLLAIRALGLLEASAAELPVDALVHLLDAKGVTLPHLCLSYIQSLKTSNENDAWKIVKALGRIERAKGGKSTLARIASDQRKRLFKLIKKIRKQAKKPGVGADTESTDSSNSKDMKKGAMPAPGGGRKRMPFRIRRAHRMSMNESAAIATLKNLMSSQAQVQASGAIDTNKNGAGEFGFFSELSGARGVRIDKDKDGFSDTEGKRRVTPPVLSGAFGSLSKQGWVLRSGYFYCIFLPGKAWQGLAEGKMPKKYPAIKPSFAEAAWVGVAWPYAYGKSGKRTFFVNQSGDVLQTENLILPYSGATNPPMSWAAFKLEGKANMAAEAAVNGVALDGRIWTIVN